MVAGHDDIDDNGDDWQLLSGPDVLQPGRGYATTHNSGAFVAGNAFINILLKVRLTRVPSTLPYITMATTATRIGIL